MTKNQYLKVGKSAKNRLFGIAPIRRLSQVASNRHSNGRPIQMLVSEKITVSNSKYILIFIYLYVDIVVWNVTKKTRNEIWKIGTDCGAKMSVEKRFPKEQITQQRMSVERRFPKSAKCGRKILSFAE